MRILVVEDDARIAGFLKKGLEESGYDVVVATNGEDGFPDARLNPYDLLVPDLMLPEMDGTATLHWSRQRSLAKNWVKIAAWDDFSTPPRLPPWSRPSSR